MKKKTRKEIYYGNTDYKSIIELLKRQGATRIRSIKHRITFIDTVLVTVTRFTYTHKGKTRYCICEPETGLFATSNKPIMEVH